MKNLRFSLTLPLLVLTVLALLSFWIEHYVQTPQKTINKQVSHHPDYFMENFVSSKTDKNGKLKSMLAAVKMQHFPDDDSLQLVRPRFTQFNELGIFNQIEAQRGVVSSNGEIAEFYEQVIVYRPPTEEKAEMHLYTPYLKLFPKKQIASTPEDVRITQGPYSTITGRGMLYDKENDEITIQKNVKIHYVKDNTEQTTQKHSAPNQPKRKDNH